MPETEHLRVTEEGNLLLGKYYFVGSNALFCITIIAGFAKPGSFVFPLGRSLPPAGKGSVGPRGFSHFLSLYHS